MILLQLTKEPNTKVLINLDHVFSFEAARDGGSWLLLSFSRQDSVGQVTQGLYVKESPQEIEDKLGGFIGIAIVR